MDIPNLLYCLILTRNTPPSLFLPSYLHLIPFIPSSLFYPSLFFPIYLSLTLCFSSFFPLSLSSFLSTICTHCTIRSKRVMFISCPQHLDIHTELTSHTPPLSPCVHLSLTSPFGRCLRRREKLQ